MQLLNKYKIFLSFVFTLFLLFCFCQSTQAKNRSIILPPPHNISPQGEVTEDKVIFEWHNDSIPPEYNLKYYVLEVTSNINERGGDFNHGLSLKVEVDKAYTRFPPTGDGFDTKKLFTDTQGRFAWRVSAFYNCADGVDSEKSVPMGAVIVTHSRIELTDMGILLKSTEDFSESPDFKSVGTLSNGKWACIFVNDEAMINVDFLRQYLGCSVFEYYGMVKGKRTLCWIQMVRYDQTVWMNYEDRRPYSRLDIINYGSDWVKTLNFPINARNEINHLFGCPYWYQSNGVDTIYVKSSILKWLGVNSIYIDKTSTNRTEWFVKIADQGLKKGFEIYNSRSNYSRPKGHYYIMPANAHYIDGETLNKQNDENLSNQLKFGSTRFNLRCAGRTICETNEYCGGYSLLRFELLEGIAKLIKAWELQVPDPDPDNPPTTLNLKIDCSYRCKIYNASLLGSAVNSGHLYGLKADLDLNIHEPKIDDKNSNGTDKYPLGIYDPNFIHDHDEYCTNQSVFRNWCSQNDKNYAKSGLTPSEADYCWADLKYDCGSNGPWFYFVNKDFKISE